MKNPDVQSIEESGKYRILSQLSYDEIVGFVFDNIRKKTLASMFYFLINILTLVLILCFAFHPLDNGEFRMLDFLKNFIIGLLGGSILVIPFHEGFHALAYKLTGAPRIHFGADLKQMIFYVAADKYVVGRKQFYLVAQAPFLLVNLLMILAWYYSDLMDIHALLFFLLFHNIMCIGDFAMISFFQSHSGKELYTYDDLKNRVSYIVEKLPGNSTE